MPHWNCERCGARLYSASKSLRRNNCPVCQGRLSPQGDVRSARFEQGQPVSLDLSDTSVVQEQVDVAEDELTRPKIAPRVPQTDERHPADARTSGFRPFYFRSPLHSTRVARVAVIAADRGVARRAQKARGEQRGSPLARLGQVRPQKVCAWTARRAERSPIRIVCVRTTAGVQRLSESCSGAE